MNKHGSFKVVQSRLVLLFANVLLCLFMFCEGSYAFKLDATKIEFGGAIQMAKVNAEFVGESEYDPLVLSYNSSTSSGGALYLQDSYVDVVGYMNGDYNKSAYGGFISGAGTSSFEGTGNVDLKGNVASHGDGGDIAYYANGTVTLGTTMTSDGRYSRTGAYNGTNGGAMYFNKSTVSFTGDLNINNYSVSGRGGALYFISSTINSSGNITIEDNRSVEYGGGIMMQSCPDVNFEGDITARRNFGQYGGFLFASTKTVVDFDGAVVLEGNEATQYDGGAIYIHFNSIANFNLSSSITATSNTAKRYGGVFMFYQSTGNFKDSIVATANEAEQHGGFGFFDYYSKIYFEGDMDFIDNKAKLYDGGVMFVYRSSTVDFISGSDFYATGNIANRYGGVFRFNGSHGRFNGTFNATGNRALSVGGIIYTNAASLTATTKMTMDRNHAKHGGAIFLDSSTTANLHSVSMSNNSADFHGGAIYLNSSSIRFSSNDNTFRNNTAVSYGGMVYNAAGALYFPSRIPTMSGNTGVGYNNAHTLCYVNNAIRYNCYCPVGQVWDGSKCVTCTGGTYWNGSSCVCPAGQNWNGSYCVACTGGTYWNGSSCVCPAGQSWNGSSCVNSCSNGMVWNGSYCACPSGQYLGYYMQDNGWMLTKVYRCWSCEKGIVPLPTLAYSRTQYRVVQGVCSVVHTGFANPCGANYSWNLYSYRTPEEFYSIDGCESSN